MVAVLEALEVGCGYLHPDRGGARMKLVDDATNAPFDVRIEEGLGRGSVIFAHGEIDMATAPLLEDAFVRCGQSCDVIVDLTQVTFIDSSALKVLTFNAKKLSKAGHQIRLQGMSDHQRRVVRLTGLSQVLNVADES
jgi:anti-sigma B factor antagonist